MTDQFEELGREALAAFEELAENPDARVHEKMAGAVRCLIRMRDGLIEEQRRNGGDGTASTRLVRVNGILSIAVGAAYPMVGIRPERLDLTRDALRNLLGSERS